MRPQILIIAFAFFLDVPAAWAGEQDPENIAPEPKAPGHLEVAGNRIRIYGFPRLDIVYSDSRMNHNQFSFWVLSEDPAVAAEDDDEFLDIYPRLTRVGLDIERDGLPFWENVQLRGKVEIDFQNAGSESRQLLRLRHGYLELRDDAYSILAGQTWDLISPLYPSVNADGLMWNAGNLGDRRPQLRLGTEREVLDGAKSRFAVAFGRTGAVDLQDLDSDGRRDGDESALPMLQARAGLASFWEGLIDVGVWGHFGWEETATPVAGEKDFTTSGGGVDLLVRITEDITFAGEAWIGENLSDLRGGIGQGVNAATGEEIASRGGWAEVRWKALEWYAVAVGGSIDDPKNDDVAASSQTANHTFYIANQFTLGGGFDFGLEYIWWETLYRGLDEGDANRFNFYVRYEF